MIIGYKGAVPDVGAAVFVADSAAVCGDVVAEEGSSIWFGAAIRAELAPIRIGKRSNVQDNATLHSDHESPVIIGDDVSVGHNAIVHGAVVEDGALIGMHATVLNGARIGKGALIAAGALVKEGEIVPERALVVGVPGTVVRTLDDAAVEHNRTNAQVYVDDAMEYARTHVAG
ncbi:gamma carbonic anhydrase family protein [Raoultibacter phocaeensis]|uniref:gamma carbonic anhydrase family protein n=1 Tax=Raoultibacter phocaeensis TaxID=2479841 RepID=UPI00111ABC63|nr:gamma carbonic anhydrase family protein [Raoultibacter phocaeensis]